MPLDDDRLIVPYCENGHLATLQAAPEDIRRETRDGREFLVAPVVAVVEGVLNGELLPAQEIRAAVDGFNGVPLPVGHPTERGQFVTANQPAILDNQVIGRFFGATFDEDRMTGELWVDIGKAERLGGQAEIALNKLERGEMLEVSTGYFRDVEQQSGIHNGERYRGIQRNLRPDHLALLVDQTGACSIADGCGAPRVAVDLVANLLEQARRPSTLAFSGTSAGEWSEPSLQDYVAALEAEASTVGDLTAEQKAEIARHTLLGDAEAETFEELSFFPVVEPSTANLNENALDAVLGGRGAQADISRQQRSSARGIARTLLEEEFDRELADNEDQQARGALQTLADYLGLEFSLGSNEPEGGDDVTDEERSERLDALAANEAVPFDEEEMDDWDDERIEAMHTQFVANAGEGDGDTDPDGGPGDGSGGDDDTDPDDGNGTANGAITVQRDELEDLIDDKVNERVEEQVEERVDQAVNADARRQLIANLDEVTEFDPEELEEFSTERLDKLARSLNVNYAGVGAPAAFGAASDDSGVPDPPQPVLGANEGEDE